MGTLYIPLDEICRSASIPFRIHNPEWFTRGRSTGGFDAKPLAVAWHHSASNTSPQNDCDYMVFSADAEPVANVLVPRDGVAWIMAGGATNTSGSGNDLPMSRGVIPGDQANTRTVGMEIANTGVGEPYTPAQLDTAFALSNAINAWCGNQPTDVFSHNAYTLSDPSNPNGSARKIDPATASAASAGGWSPGSVNSSGTWSNGDLQAECAQRAGTPQPLPPTRPPPPPSEDDDMKLYAAKDSNGTIWIGNGIHRYAPTFDSWNVTVLRSSSGSGPPLLSACGSGQAITNPGDITCVMDDTGLDSLGVITEAPSS